jgi:hypothetical protein
LPTHKRKKEERKVILALSHSIKVVGRNEHGFHIGTAKDIDAHFIPCQKMNDATHIMNLFFKEVVKLHDLPRSIIFDRDTKLVGHFWRTLWKKLGTNLSFSSAYHPHMDGQTEVVNRSLGDLLRILVTEHHIQWDHILPQEEFYYNDSFNRSIGHNPFQIVYGM